MKTNTSNEKNFYSQGQQFVARILLAAWLLASSSPEVILAAPKGQMTPDTATSPDVSSLVTTPPTPLPGGQLPPESPASDEVGASSQHPAVSPSDAIITSSPATPSALQQLMSREGVPDNEELIAALNAVTPQEQYPWIEAAIRWFANQQIEALNPAAIRDYVALAHVQVTSENRKLLKRYFDSLCNKVKDGPFGEELLIQALAYVLAHLDPAIFAGDPEPLLGLGTNLLAKLNPSQREFKQAGYPSARASLEALFHTFLLVEKIAPGYLNVRDGGLYQHFRNHLQEIIERAQYYPVIYQSRILMQTLRLLEDPEPDLEGNMKRITQGLLGVANLVAVGRGLAKGDLRLDELQTGIGLLQEAFKEHRIQLEAWYSQLLSLEEAMLRCLKEGDLCSYPDSEELVQHAKDIPSQCRKREKAAALVGRLVASFPGADTINQYKEALRFGIVMQLRTLSLQGSTPELRQGSIERLISLGQPSCWGTKTEVMAGLLESLALVAVQSQSDPDRVVESTMAKGALSALITREELSSKLQRLREQTTEQAPSDEERLVTHVKGTQRRTATTESFRAQEMANIAQLSSYILLAKLSHFVERTDITKQLSAILANQDKGVCVLYGFGGAGKSTLAALYGHGRKDTQIVRWIGAEESFKLQEGYEQLAQELQVAYQPLAKKLAADDSQYCQELARMVYNALAKSSQPTLLILDNAQDASLVADYLLHRPAAIQAIITTRSSEAFEGKYDQLQLGPFSQDEGESYLEVRFKEMNRAYTNPEVTSLLKEVGLVAQKLNLAAGYLQANKLVTTAQYIARLQALKQAGTKQQGRLTLPEVALGLETLTREGQQLMQYAAYLDADFIPLSLVSILLEEDDLEQLSEVASDLSRLSLMQVVSTNAGQEVGLQVHREVQASCREYAGWSPEAALGTRETILLQLARVLKAQMPFVKSAPDNRWQQARLYVPHVTTVVTALEDSGAAPSAVVARLLELMGEYSQQVGLNYRQAVSFYQRALAIYEQVYHETPNHPEIASTLGNLGIAWSDLGDARQAVTYFERALAIYEQVYHETPNHPDIASTLNNLGLAWQNLGEARQAASFYQRALAMREQVYHETPNHPDIARTLVGLGNVWSDLGDARQAVSFLERALAIFEQVYQETPNHPDIAMTLGNLGGAWRDLGDGRQAVSFYQRALAIFEQVYHETPNHPDIARTLIGLGNAWDDLDDGRQAVSFYQRALAIFEQVYHETPNHPEIASTLNNLGAAWQNLGDGRQAVSFLERALAIYEQVYHETPNHPDIAHALHNLGNAWDDLDDGRQAVSFYQRALAIFEQVYHETPNHPDIAKPLIGLGTAWGALGDTRQAVTYFERALAIYKQVYQATPNHPEIASTLNNLGLVYEQNLSDYSKALEYYQKAFAMQQALHEGEEDHLAIAQASRDLERARRALGEGQNH